jgi:hypothetical protein
MATSDEWAQDGSPTGGIGTIPRPAGEPAAEPGERRWRRPAAPPPATPRRAVRPHRPTRGKPGRGAPSRDPKGAPPDDREAWEGSGGRKSSFSATREEGGPKRPEASGESRASGTSRVPFFLVLCGLLGGALICALVISTTLAEGSFQITRLQQANTSLAKQRQLLAEQVAAAQSAQVIQERALQLGMRPVGQVRFLNLKNGKIQTDAGSGAVQDIHVPGYTP